MTTDTQRLFRQCDQVRLLSAAARQVTADTEDELALQRIGAESDDLQARVYYDAVPLEEVGYRLAQLKTQIAAIAGGARV